jgi:hypothetical protein
MIQKRLWTVEADMYIRWLVQNKQWKWAEIAENVRLAFPEYQSKTNGAIKSRYYKYENETLALPEDTSIYRQMLKEKWNESVS